jgi:hypothetical protein
MFFFSNEKKPKMKPSINTMISFYQQLGKVFYSVAAVDKNVQEEEVEQLKQVVKKEWLPIEDSLNEFGDDSAYQIEIVFDWLVRNNWDTEDLIPDFKIFRKEHPSLFTAQVNALILKTTNAIATSLSKKNKLELVLVNELSAILHQEN